MLREEFAIFEEAPALIDPVLPFVYLDSAATMQRPNQVIEREVEYYKTQNANPLRGLYKLSEQSTEVLNQTRIKVAKYIGADPDEVVFIKNATEGINLIANGVREVIGEKDKILVSLDSHHSNILPFTERYGKQVVVTEDILGEFKRGKEAVKIVALTGLSNVSGEEQNELIRELRESGYGGAILVDAAQLVAHRRIDVKKMDVDFLVFSGHKMGAPMGVGILYMRREWMEKITPLNYGGEMVEGVECQNGAIKSEFAFGPQKFEGGTINMGGVAGLSAAIDFWQEHNKDNKLFGVVEELTSFLKEQIGEIEDAEMYYAKNGIVLLNIKGVHAHDTAQILSNYGVMVRAGWHCAEPFLTEKKIGPAVRVSLMFYNTKNELKYLTSILKKVRSEMGL
ncbi:aminotransferase class V-fold PLP-dependent enzyme [Candidatus Nanosyncoccus nanoralicus]|uniref:Cysteine desulfurase n=1 Tax=Candidatus Nanosyncoccus nanoralicus TaxID=2171996 RepID=A0ABY0FKI1_9BACT|nr:aminotransferase class V-fold PLP-dependent enzyme [Candidatus Nanosyncoccus nanoralicus]RYC73904.1 Cysteine desulfurase [Candidatus Nanosyncoccus nanoralicus]